MTEEVEMRKTRMMPSWDSSPEGSPGTEGAVAFIQGEKHRFMAGRWVHAGGDGSAQGAPGAQGPQGPEGPQGLRGPAGERGPVGPAGPAGDVGAPGPAGVEGARGPAGEQGVAGPAGPRGLQGETGTSFELQGEVASEGDLPAGASMGHAYVVGSALWVMGAQGWVSIGEVAQGPAGPQGEQGPEGPRGLDGSAGAPGEPGPAGPAGEPGPTGEQGPEGATGLRGPQGVAGVAGAQGPAGPRGRRGPGADRRFFGSSGPYGSWARGTVAIFEGVAYEALVDTTRGPGDGYFGGDGVRAVRVTASDLSRIDQAGVVSPINPGSAVTLSAAATDTHMPFAAFTFQVPVGGEPSRFIYALTLRLKAIEMTRSSTSESPELHVFVGPSARRHLPGESLRIPVGAIFGLVEDWDAEAGMRIYQRAYGVGAASAQAPYTIGGTPSGDTYVGDLLRGLPWDPANNHRGELTVYVALRCVSGTCSVTLAGPPSTVPADVTYSTAESTAANAQPWSSGGNPELFAQVRSPWLRLGSVEY